MRFIACVTLLFLLLFNNGLVVAAGLEKIEWSETEDERIKIKYIGNQEVKRWVFKKKPMNRGRFKETFEYLPKFSAYEFLPFDEAHFDSSFILFRRKLLTIIEKQDKKALFALIDPEDGHKDPDKTFTAHVGVRGDFIFDELKFCLSNGGRFFKNNRRSFLAPYVAAGWPEKYEFYEFEAIVKGKVKAYSAPSEKAPVIATIGHCIVRSSSRPLSGWVRIGLPSGRVAYVREECLWRDFGFYFVKKGDRWYIGGVTPSC